MNNAVTTRPRAVRWRRARVVAVVALRCLGVAVTAAVMVVSLAPVATAAPGPVILAVASISQVIANIRTWLTGILAAVATLFLVVGGVRYLIAGGDPSEVERAKQALKSAAIGYALAVLAPVLVQLIGQWVGA